MVELDFVDVSWKTGDTREKPSEQGENHNKRNQHAASGLNRTRATLGITALALVNVLQELRDLTSFMFAFRQLLLTPP